ncbi:hypothetical protein AWM68_17320 [Fictibacillus phosphorivorans]|uniref:Uncharacterized protein n=1 Tax=Fictibacillus phosphorivorans TaxID=1221500 RepID=A0A163S145_9BACL|nr:hypothetical protein [Fictibacillus phosphorivorans]KZE67934.1 hypothetical protein AWM68_17320 [Fictibacillus phosphorivorans]
MQYHVISLENNEIKCSDGPEGVREFLEDLFYLKFDFNPMLQDNDESGELEVYLHTDTYDECGEEQLNKLDELGITECDSLQTICNLLGIKIDKFSKDEIASCTVCKTSYHENEINMVDYDVDVCTTCEPAYKTSV